MFQRPAGQFAQLVLVDHKLRLALGTDNGVAAITSGFTPFENVAEGVAIAVTEM